MRVQLTTGHREALLLSGEQSFASMSPAARYGGFVSRGFSDEEAAKSYLKTFLTDRSSLGSLRRALSHSLPPGFVLRLSDDQLLAELARRIVAGRLYVVERRGRPTHPPLATSAAATAPRPPVSAMPPPEPAPAPATEPEAPEQAAPVEEEPPAEADPVLPEEVDLIAQAVVMQQASQSGAAVCEA